MFVFIPIAMHIYCGGTWQHNDCFLKVTGDTRGEKTALRIR